MSLISTFLIVLHQVFYTYSINPLIKYLPLILRSEPDFVEKMNINLSECQIGIPGNVSNPGNTMAAK